MKLFVKSMVASLALAVLALAVANQASAQPPAAGSGPAKLKVIISWSDDVDVDLHVLEPAVGGFPVECYYGNKETVNGGKLNKDSRHAGSEEYEIIAGPAGHYVVDMVMYARNGDIGGSTTVTYSVWVNGVPKVEGATHVLGDNGSRFQIGDFSFASN